MSRRWEGVTDSGRTLVVYGRDENEAWFRMLKHLEATGEKLQKPWTECALEPGRLVVDARVTS